MTARTGPGGLLILDRDGVINRDSAQFVKNTDAFQPLAGSIDAIAMLLRLARHYRVSLDGVPAIGDSLRDVAIFDDLASAASALVNA